MKLKAVLETLEGLDDQFHGLYGKEGDKFVLQVDDFASHPKAHGLSATVTKLRDENKALKPAAGKWNELVELRGGDADVTPDAVHEAIESKSGGSDKDVELRVQESVTKAVERAEAKAKRELEKLGGERDTAMGALRKRVVDSDLDREIAAAGVIEKYRPAVRAMLKELGPEMVQENGDFRGIFKADADGIPREVSIKDFVAGWKQSSVAAAFLPAEPGGSGAPQPGGGGGGGGGGKTMKVQDGMVIVDPAAVTKGDVRIVA